MATFKGVNEGGEEFTFEAADSKAALSNTNLGKTSGVFEVKQPAGPATNVQTPNTPVTTGNDTAGTPGDTSGSQNEFLSALTSSLLNSPAISSKSSDIEQRINNAMGGVQASADASGQRIESQFDRAISVAEGNQDSSITGRLESRRGFGTNITALRELVKTTDSNINDLRQRKQEALLANDSEAASQLAGLEMKALEFKMDAEQRAFSNMLGLGNLGLSVQQVQQQQEQQMFSQTMDKVSFLQDNNLLGDMDAAGKAELEQTLGLDPGVIDNIKSKEEMNLQVVSGVGLVNVTRDANGKVKTTLLQASKNSNDKGFDNDQKTAQELNSMVGEDGFVAPETYQKAKNDFIARGGTLTEFLEEFPSVVYLSEGSQSFIPENLRIDLNNNSDLF